MILDLSEVHRILTSKGVGSLFHANSVVTSCHFIQKKALLSRQAMESDCLYMTTQKSDDKDRELGIWNDVFLDTVDIHERASDRNLYGPVTFEIDIAILNSLMGVQCLVTKSNPIYWKSQANEGHWFGSIEELARELVVGSFGHMVVLRCPNGKVAFDDHLKSLKIDENGCRFKNEFQCCAVGLGALLFAGHSSGVSVQPKRRVCSFGCKCGSSYQRDIDVTRVMYFPAEYEPTPR